MKRLLILLFCFCNAAASAQEEGRPFDGHTWKAPYQLPIPTGWNLERFLIPISFAPSIPYQGVEDIRFAPGWAAPESEEYWTYAFLWWLQGSPTINAPTLGHQLEAYYTGLISINTDSSKLAAVNPLPVTALFKKTATFKTDKETYTGTVTMLDYMQLKPITLYCMVHLQTCGAAGSTVMFYELSPKPFNHVNWQKLHTIWAGFACPL
jgi:hypothetical protein